MRLYLLSCVSILLLAMAPSFSGAVGEIIINEIMYNPDQNQGRDDYFEWVELYNTGASAVDLSGWTMRDNDPENEPFVIPDNTEIEAGDYLVICGNFSFIYYTYDIPVSKLTGNFSGRFGLANGGDTVTVLDASDNVVDEVIYNDAYPWPFQPDGAGPSLERINPLGESNDPRNWAASLRRNPTDRPGTPGTQNSLFSEGTAPPVVINEIHYHPACGSDDDEYIELYNASDTAQPLSGWQFTRGVFFDFPEGASIAPFGYLLVCKNKDWIQDNYNIETEAVYGDYTGFLDNGGETVVLRDDTGRLVDFVAYSDEEYWPTAADGYGSSLECINPNFPNSDPANWTAGLLTHQWVFVQSLAGSPTGDTLYFYLNGEGEVLLDDVALVPEGGGENLVPNGDFEAGDAGWVKLGNHSTSSWTDATSHAGAGCMRIVSTGDGGPGEWRNYVGISIPAVFSDGKYLLSFWAKPVSGETRLTAKLANSDPIDGVYAAVDLSKGGFASSPGSPNNAYTENLPPFIYHVRHLPDIPTSRDSTDIAVRIVDDGPVSLVSVSLEYNLGLGEEWVSTPMYDDGEHADALAGDAEFGAKISRCPSNTIVRYRIVAQDDQGGVTVSPDADDLKSTHSYFCYDGEVASNLPIYFLFISEENLHRLEELGSRDDYVAGTFVFQGRVYDDVGVRWYGSFSERVATTKKNWRVKFNPWDKLFRENMYDMSSLILLGGDYDDRELRGSACLREVLTHNVCRYAGCAYSETEYVHLQLNGAYYGLMLRVERPDTDYLERNNRDAAGDLFQARSFAGQPPSNMSVLPGYDDYLFAYERKTNRIAPHSTLISLIESLENVSEDDIAVFLNEQLNVEKYTSYLAAAAFAQNWVSPTRDYYLFHGNYPVNSEERYLWEVMPWGGEHNWDRPSLPVLNGIAGENDYSLPNMMRTRFFNVPLLQMQFADRLRHLLDTTYTEQHLFSVIDTIGVHIAAAADYDRAYWWPEADSFASQVAALKSNMVARRDFLYQWLDGVEGPAQPVNLSPAADSRYLSDPIALVSSAFSGVAGSFHESSQWQVRAEEVVYSTPVWDSGEDAVNKTTIVLPSGALPEEQKFFWHVRHKDDQGRWSLWSEETSFTTDLDRLPPSIVSVFCVPEVDDEVVVAFSEPVDPASAENVSNYLLNGQDTALAASLSPDGLTVTLTVSPGLPLFTLTVSDISDTAVPPNVILPGTGCTIQVWSSETKINFQPVSEPVPDGYLEDTGAPFDGAAGYGWTFDNTSLSQVRGLHSDARLDTFLQFAGEDSRWEIALPSPGRYRVTAWLGDPASESIYNFAVEGSWLVSGLYLPPNEFREVAADVNLTDGRLSLDGGSIYKGTRIAYLHILSAASGFKVSALTSSTSDPDWMDITWSDSPGASWKIDWSEDLFSWNEVTPDPADLMIDGQAGTVTWTDKGTSPGMGGLPPGQAPKRFYRVGLSSE